MNVEDIEETIQNCPIQGLDIQITKHNIEEALDQLIPCLAFVGELEARCEYECNREVYVHKSKTIT